MMRNYEAYREDWPCDTCYYYQQAPRGDVRICVRGKTEDNCGLFVREAEPMMGDGHIMDAHLLKPGRCIVQFGIGDRVRVARGVWLEPGATGTITTIGTSRDPWDYMVRLDSGITGAYRADWLKWEAKSMAQDKEKTYAVPEMTATEIQFVRAQANLTRRALGALDVGDRVYPHNEVWKKMRDVCGAHNIPRSGPVPTPQRVTTIHTPNSDGSTISFDVEYPDADHVKIGCTTFARGLVEDIRADMNDLRDKEVK